MNDINPVKLALIWILLRTADLLEWGAEIVERIGHWCLDTRRRLP